MSDDGKEGAAAPIPWLPGFTPATWGEDIITASGGWKREVVQLPHGTEATNRWVLRAPCPRCRDELGIDAWLPGETVVAASSGFGRRSLDVAAMAAAPTFVECTGPSAAVQGRPNDVHRGCGAGGPVPLVGVVF